MQWISPFKTILQIEYERHRLLGKKQPDFLMQQNSLFMQADDTTGGRTLDVNDADLRLPQFSLPRSRSIICAIAKRFWRQQHHIRIAGIMRAQPRLSAWYGDADAAHSYSGLHLKPLPWHPLLNKIRTRLEHLTEHRFNSVLARPLP